MSDPSLFDEQPEPIRPYWQDGEASSGWSGSDTSKDSEPVRLDAQQRVWLALRKAGEKGLTWSEAADALNTNNWTYPNVHHGTASGALSNLHKAGHAARLTEKRLRRKVYVLPSLVGDRDSEAPIIKPTRKELARDAFAAGHRAAWADLPRDDTFDKWWDAQ